MKIIKVISCAITIILMAFIFFFSSQTAVESSAVSMGITYRVATFISKIVGGYNTETAVGVLENIIRTMAHFFLFFLLGISVQNVLFRFSPKRHKKYFLWGFLFCVIYAVSDEIHQMFVPGRAAMLNDIVTDSTGAIVGILLYILLAERILRRYKNGN